ncbi:MAG TPA: preprotein translocase subunit SecE, partial [Caulobacteraceae bacterium]
MARSKTLGARGGKSGKRPATPPPVVAAAAEPAAPKKRTSPVQFGREVRAEARKISWPSRKETWITSVMVFIMVVLAAVFFWIVDLILGFGASQLIQ